MGRLLKGIVAALLVCSGIAGVTFLLSEGLDRAEKWFSIFAGTVSVVIALVGLWLAWRAWKAPGGPGEQNPALPPPRRKIRARRTGSAKASGAGSVANSGVVINEQSAAAVSLNRTGNAQASDGGAANSGYSER